MVMIICGGPLIALGALTEIRGMTEIGRVIQYVGVSAVIGIIVLSVLYLFFRDD